MLALDVRAFAIWTLHYMSIVVSWVVTPCGFVGVTIVLEEYIASILRIDAASMILKIHFYPRKDLKTELLLHFV
jgi:hypothetical protein